MLNKVQKEHLNHILKTTDKLISKKYKKGAKEHKTTLNTDHTSMELIDMAIEEAIDQITYLLTIKEVMEDERRY